MKYLFIISVIMCGCKSAERRASEDQIDCMYKVLTNDRLSQHEQSDLVKGCHSVWKIRTGNL